MNHVVNIAEAKARLSALLAAVDGGDVVTITRHGQPVARLIGAGPARRAGGELAHDPAWRDFRYDPALFAPLEGAALEDEGWPG